MRPKDEDRFGQASWHTLVELQDSDCVCRTMARVHAHLTACISQRSASPPLRRLDLRHPT